GGDAAADARGVERDATVDVLDAAADLRAAAEHDRAVDGLDRGADACVRAELRAAIDRLQRGRAGAVAEADAAVDGRDVLGGAARLDPDRSVHRFQVACLLVTLDADRTVDLVDIDAAREGTAGQ